RSSSASPSSPWRRSANTPSPTSPACCSATPTRRRSAPTTRRPPRRAISTCARPASTVAATKFRRTSCPNWSWGYKARKNSGGRRDGPVPFRRTEAAAGGGRAVRSRQVSVRDPAQDRRDREGLVGGELGADGRAWLARHGVLGGGWRLRR